MGWKDATTFETEFVLAVSVNGSEYVTLDEPIASTTRTGYGAQYGYTTPKLPANLRLQFRIKARNPGARQESSFSLPTAECRTHSATSRETGCYVGRIDLQGRSNHGGAWLYHDGFPVAQTDGNGAFQVCGVKPGEHTISGGDACYLRAVAQPMSVQAGQKVKMPTGALYGGDVNNDGVINIFDLVRIGADYRSAPPNDPGADCNEDHRVDLFDLVLVGSNYDMEGPLPWAYKRPPRDSAAAPGHRVPPSVDAADGPQAAGAAPRAEGPLPAGIVLRQRRLGARLVALDVIAPGAHGLYGADVTLRFDPDALRPIDPGNGAALQATPGAVWKTGGGYVAVNRVDPATGTVRFAASRMKPSAPLVGDVHVATVVLEAHGAPAEPGVTLVDARLADRAGDALGQRAAGPAQRWRRLLYLPAARLWRAEGTPADRR